MSAALLVLALPSALWAGSITYLDGDFVGWESFIIQQTADLTATAGQIPTGGNPDAYQRHAFHPVNALVSPGSHRVVLASLGGIVYDPSAYGGIESLIIGYDLTRISDNPTFPHAGQVRPYIRQGDLIFSLFFGGGGAAVEDPAVLLGGWTSYGHTSTSASDWVDIDGSSNLPDFSAAGAPIQFGYRIALMGTCQGQNPCTASAVISGIDNYQVTVRYTDPEIVPDPSVVPEPASVVLLGTGLLAIGLELRRRARATAGRSAR